MNRSQLEICRDVSGFYDISRLDGICKKTELFCTNAVALYELNDCALIFKKYSESSLSHGAFNEVLYSRIAKKLGIYSAEYGFASRGEETGTLSYRLSGKYVTLARLGFESGGVKSLTDFFDKEYGELSGSLKRELLRLIALDALLGHSDRCGTNLLLWENETGSEAHLYSVDCSDLFGRCISLEKRGKELFSFINSLTDAEKENIQGILNGVDVPGEIELLASEYPVYSDIAKTACEKAKRTKQLIFNGRNEDILPDYLLYPEREIRVKRRG